MRTLTGFEGAPGPAQDGSGLAATAEDYAALAAHCDGYKGADHRRSVLQLTSTLVLFAGGCAAMIYSVHHQVWWLYALLLLPTAGLLVRLFIVQHDCGHGSYFRTRKLNDMVGRCLGVLTVTPYAFWRRTHNMHHAGSGNLERRGYGGIETLTVEEYKSLAPRQKLIYRLYRNVFLMLGLGTPLFIIIGQRFAFTEPFPFPEFSRPSEMTGLWPGVIGTNVAMVVFFGGLSLFTGAGALAAVYLPVLVVTAWVGGWLFYIQHQFEETHWDKHKDWSFQQAALEGSSYYVLPPVLQWFTGNIGIHHIHHLCALIPNYKLQACVDASPRLKAMNRMTLADSLKCVNLALWDEKARRLVSFREAAAL